MSRSRGGERMPVGGRPRPGRPQGSPSMQLDLESFREVQEVM